MGMNHGVILSPPSITAACEPPALMGSNPQIGCYIPEAVPQGAIRVEGTPRWWLATTNVLTTRNIFGIIDVWFSGPLCDSGYRARLMAQPALP